VRKAIAAIILAVFLAGSPGPLLAASRPQHVPVTKHKVQKVQGHQARRVKGMKLHKAGKFKVKKFKRVKRQRRR
jgi:hypothetical protein